MDNAPRPPGLKWPLLLGAAGFAAGFFGPMIFDRDANQGPLVGILITGPAGVALGLLLLALCTLARTGARTQWRLLKGSATTGVLLILALVQPGPAPRGYVMELQIRSCTELASAQAQVIDHWQQRIAKVNWAAARPGWQQDMRQTLGQAPGVIVDVAMRRQLSVWERRKPWDRGELFATAGRPAPDEHSFYYPSGTCSDLSAGSPPRAFEKYELNGRIQPPSDWPPRELEQILPVSPIAAVPARFEALAVEGTR